MAAPVIPLDIPLGPAMAAAKSTGASPARGAGTSGRRGRPSAGAERIRGWSAWAGCLNFDETNQQNASSSVPSPGLGPGGTSLTRGGPDELRRRPAGRLIHVAGLGTNVQSPSANRAWRSHFSAVRRVTVHRSMILLTAAVQLSAAR